METEVRYNESDVGNAIMNFLRNIDTIESHIGEIKPSSNCGSQRGKQLMVIGASRNSGETSCGQLMKYVDDTTIPILDLLGSGNRVKLSKYLDNSQDVPKEEAAELKSKFDDIIKYRSVMVPFRLGEEVTADFSEEKDKQPYMEKGSIVAAKVRLLLDEKKMAGEIVVARSDGEGKTRTKGFPYEDYMKSYKISRLEALNTSRKSDECIRMTPCGYIQPVQFVKKLPDGKEMSVIIDNTSIYSLNNNIALRVCDLGEYMERRDKALKSKVVEKALLKALKDHAEYIYKHRRCVAAVTMCQNTVIEV